MESWSSWAENIMDPTILMGSCSSANSGGTPTTTQGGLSPCRDLMISANHGGCLPLAAGVFWLWLYLWGWWDWWTCHQGGGCRFWLPYAMGCHKCSSGSSPMAPAAASFPNSWGICRLQCPSGHNFDPVRGQAVIQNLCICEWGQRFHGSLELQCTLCQLVRLTWHWWLGFLHLILESLGIRQGHLGLFQVVVLSPKPHIRKGQKSVLFQGVRGQWCWIIIGHPLGMAAHFGQLEWCPDPPYKLLDVALAGDLEVLLPPSQGVKLLNMPIDPFETIVVEGLRWQGLLGVISSFCSGQETFQVRLEGKQVLLLHSGLFNIFPGEWTGLPSSSILFKVILKSDPPSKPPRAGRLDPSLGISSCGGQSVHYPMASMGWDVYPSLGTFLPGGPRTFDGNSPSTCSSLNASSHG